MISILVKPISSRAAVYKKCLRELKFFWDEVPSVLPVIRNVNFISTSFLYGRECCKEFASDIRIHDSIA